MANVNGQYVIICQDALQVVSPDLPHPINEPIFHVELWHCQGRTTIWQKFCWESRCLWIPTMRIQGLSAFHTAADIHGHSWEQFSPYLQNQERRSAVCVWTLEQGKPSVQFSEHDYISMIAAISSRIHVGYAAQLVAVRNQKLLLYVVTLKYSRRKLQLT